VRRLLFAVALAAGLVLPAIAAAPGRADAVQDARRAVASYDAMQRYLFVPSTGHYRESPGADATAQAWPFSQALAAAVSVAKLPSARVAADVTQRLRALERFRHGDAYAAWPGGSVYVDDNEWIAEALLDWSAVRGDAKLRARAVALFGVVTRAWDADAQHPCTGGVFWTNDPSNHDRNTVTTANAALLGLRLYGVTRRPSYLAWSKKTLEWVERCMLAPNGLYWDHIDLDGAVNESQWSYNQGILIGAYLRLYGATGDATALAHAEAIADAALTYFDPRWDGQEPPEFAAIFFRHLLRLAAADGRRD
jgi:predicted alpha-1,6-mannanase (GH76 family)